MHPKKIKFFYFVVNFYSVLRFIIFRRRKKDDVTIRMFLLISYNRNKKIDWVLPIHSVDVKVETHLKEEKRKEKKESTNLLFYFYDV